ncbi:hypothetical protein ACLOJK_005025 [Asimina triloba]
MHQWWVKEVTDNDEGCQNLANKREEATTMMNFSSEQWRHQQGVKDRCAVSRYEFFRRTSMRKMTLEEEATTSTMLGDPSDRRWGVAVDQGGQEVLLDEGD